MTSDTSALKAEARAWRSTYLEPAIYWHLWLGCGAAVQAVFVLLTVGRSDGMALAYPLALGISVAVYYNLYRGHFPARRRSVFVIGGSVLACLLLVTTLDIPHAAMSTAMLGAAGALTYAYTGLELRGTAFFAWGKPVLLALVWACFTTAVPMALADSADVGLLLSRFAFYGALALAFDYRDRYADLRTGLRTISARWPRRALAAVAVVLLGASAAAPVYVDARYATAWLYPLSAASVLGAAWVSLAFRQNPPPGHAYELYLDGLLILPAPLAFMLLLLPR